MTAWNSVSAIPESEGWHNTRAPAEFVAKAKAKQTVDRLYWDGEGQWRYSRGNAVCLVQKREWAKIDFRKRLTRG